MLAIDSSSKLGFFHFYWVFVYQVRKVVRLSSLLVLTSSSLFKAGFKGDFYGGY